MANNTSIPELQFHSKIDNDKGIEIVDLATLYARAPYPDHNPSKPHRLQFYGLIYIEKGSGQHFVDFNNYPFSSRSFILVNQGQAHAFDLLARAKGKMMLFTKEFVSTSHNNIRMPFFAPHQLEASYSPLWTCTADSIESAERIMSEIQKEQHQPEPNVLLLQLLFASFLLIIMRQRPLTSLSVLSPKQIQKFTDFISLLEKHYLTNREATIYADMLNLSYKSLNQLCKQAVNKTAKQLIDAHTILEAKRSLVIDGLPVQALAYKLGFEEDSNFVKYFKKHSGFTPAQFRQQYDS